MNESIAHLLRLTMNERRVLRALPELDGFNVADTARAAKIPRMSTYVALASLKKRGLVDFSRKGRRRFWVRLSHERLANTLYENARTLSPSHNRVVVTHSEQSGFTTLRGLPHLYTIFERIARGHRGERLSGIQPTGSMKYAVSKLGWKKIEPIQKAIVRNRIIVEGILREDYYPTLLNLLPTKKLKSEALASFAGRLTDMTIVTNNYLQSESELMMFRDIAFLVNWKDEVALEIKNKEILALLHESFQLMRGYGKKFDQHAYLAKLEEVVG